MRVCKTLLFMLMVPLCTVAGDAAEEAKPRVLKSSAGLKEYLNLPYDAEFSSRARETNLDALKHLVKEGTGIANFALLPRGDEADATRGRVSFDVCSPDLSGFSVSVSKLDSCRDGCAFLYTSFQDYSSIAHIPDYEIPTRRARSYSLLSLSRAAKHHLCLDRGLLISVQADRWKTGLGSPTNRDVLIAQADLLIDAIGTVVDGKAERSDEQKAYYQALRDEYAAAKRTGAKFLKVVETPATAAKLKLTLMDPKDPAKRADQNRIITGKSYVLSTATDKVIPVVKIADPKAVNAKCARPILSATARNISDIRFQALRAGKRYHVDAALRSDGRYEVSFNGTGQRVLNVFYLDKCGTMVASGGLKVEVQADPDHERFMAEYKRRLSLPYDKRFGARASETKLEKLDGITGLGEFALVPPDGSELKRRLVEISKGDRHNKPYAAFYACSPDLSKFLVMVKRPESCGAACDEIWKAMSMLHRRPRTLDDMSTTISSSATAYTVKDRYGQRWHICLKRGLLVTITRMWCLCSPTNNEVVAAQMDRLMAEVFSVLDNEKPVLTEKDKTYYSDLKAAHHEALQAHKNHTWFDKAPTPTDKFRLTLTALSVEQPSPRMRTTEAAAPRRVRMGKPYLLSRVDGRAIPVVKIADAREVGKRSASRPTTINTVPGTADVVIQTLFRGEPGYVEPLLRDDGLYQVTFPECGKRTLQLLYLDRTGNVTQFAELPVVIEE